MSIAYQLPSQGSYLRYLWKKTGIDILIPCLPGFEYLAGKGNFVWEFYGRLRS